MVRERYMHGKINREKMKPLEEATRVDRDEVGANIAFSRGPHLLIL